MPKNSVRAAWAAVATHSHRPSTLRRIARRVKKKKKKKKVTPGPRLSTLAVPIYRGIG